MKHDDESRQRAKKNAERYGRRRTGTSGIKFWGGWQQGHKMKASRFLPEEMFTPHGVDDVLEELDR